MSSTISGAMSPIPVSPATSGSVSPASGAKEGGFGAVLRNAIDQVEQLHQDAQGQVTEMLQGDRQDIHNVMIAVEKADVAFQLMMQVRNKIVNAYQEVSRLQF
jgi:flagellar hook-basal body complex protein FliE